MKQKNMEAHILCVLLLLPTWILPTESPITDPPSSLESGQSVPEIPLDPKVHINAATNDAPTPSISMVPNNAYPSSDTNDNSNGEYTKGQAEPSFSDHNNNDNKLQDDPLQVQANEQQEKEQQKPMDSELNNNDPTGGENQVVSSPQNQNDAELKTEVDDKQDLDNNTSNIVHHDDDNSEHSSHDHNNIETQINIPPSQHQEPFQTDSETHHAIELEMLPGSPFTGTHTPTDPTSLDASTTTTSEGSAAAEDEENKTMASKTEDIPSFSEWTKLQLSKKQESLLQMQNNGGVAKETNKKEDGKNFASPDCGAKILLANPEAQNPNGILSSSHDEYMLNRCGISSWFIIDLCEPIKLEKIAIGNLELFSSSPKEIEVGVSDRYPTRDWVKIGPLELPDSRAIHSFPINSNSSFSKFLKIQVLSHHGHEHYCPISVVRIYGKSEYDVLENESAHPGDDDGTSMDNELGISEDTIISDGGISKTSVIGSAVEVAINMVKKAAQVLGKRESSLNSEADKSCQSTTGCISMDKQLNQVNVTEVCNWKLLYFIQAHSHYFFKNSSCQNIFNTHCIGTPGQVEGFWRALFGDGILYLVCSYMSPLRHCTAAEIQYNEENLKALNGNWSLNTNTTPEQIPQIIPQEQKHENINGQQQQQTKPVTPDNQGVPLEKLPVVEEESRMQKESVFVRLTNRIKALERNQSLSSGYLEEISQRFTFNMVNVKKQSEEAYSISQNLKKSLNESLSKFIMLQEITRKETSSLRRSVADLRVSLWKTEMQRGFLIFVAMVQFLGILFFCCWTRRQISNLENKIQSRILLDSSSKHSSPSRHQSSSQGGKGVTSTESQQQHFIMRKRSNSHPDIMKPKKKKKKKEQLLKQFEKEKNVFNFVPTSSTCTTSPSSLTVKQITSNPSCNTNATANVSSHGVITSTSTTSSSMVGNHRKELSSNFNTPTNNADCSFPTTTKYNSNASYYNNQVALRPSNLPILDSTNSDPSSINRFGILASPSIQTLNNSFESVSSATSSDSAAVMTYRKDITDSPSSIDGKSKGGGGKKMNKLKNFIPKLFDK